VRDHPCKGVYFWLPREDEHDLASSLGLCETDRDVLRAMIDGACEQTARDHPGVPVRVCRWHAWRVVRAMQKLRVTNTPDGRAAAYVYLATWSEGD